MELLEKNDRKTNNIPAIKMLGRVGIAAGLVGGGLVVDRSLTTPVEAQPDQQSQLTLLRYSGNPNGLNIVEIPYNGTTRKMLEETADDFSFIPPFNEYSFNIYTKDPVEDLKCNQLGECDWDAVNREIDRITGIIPHRIAVIIKSDYQFYNNGRGFIANRNELPNSHTSFSMVKYDGQGAFKDEGDFRKLYSSVIAHELSHTLGLGHGGGDIDIMHPNSSCYCFNEEHTQYLRAVKVLLPYAFLNPKNNVKLLSPTISLSGQVPQTVEMSQLAVVFTPIGTTQLYSEVVPFNNDGAGVFDYAGTPEAVHAWSEIGRRIPPPPQWYGLLPDMTYTWKICSTGIAIPLLKENDPNWKNDPKWQQVEGWPGVFFPNGCDIKQFRTPKRFSDGINPLTLASGQETNNLTPTLSWDNKDKDVFYYEIQLSKDPDFNTDPQTANAAVYHELVHGGITNPINSYTVRRAFPLERGVTYFWRVKPRVQGDGTPVSFSAINSFKTTADARIQMYSEALVDKDYGNGIIGPSQADYDRANPPG